MGGLESYRLAAMGDVMLARNVGRHFAAEPDDFQMNDVRRVLEGFDLVCLNLESPVGTKGSPDPVQDPHVTFRAAPETLDILKRLGTTLVSLGNNHMLDYGAASLIETLELLDEAGIRWVGAGRDYEEANRPLLITHNGRQTAFLSYAFIYSANTRMAGKGRAGVADHRLSRILPRIRELKRSGRDVIVLIHWGKEYSFYPLPYQMRQARRMIDHGASLILGHGPHYPQGIEQYCGAQIVYSLGNFIFDEPHKFANRSFIYGVELDGSGLTRQTEIFPVHLVRHVPALVHGEKKTRLERLIGSLSAAYPRKDRRFWKDISHAYLTDLCGRVIRTRSVKYLRVPPWSFYRDVGLGSIVRKLKPANMVGLFRGRV
jgi:poly-gamma-glutamate capsule biosynthesis protein CapA/YwtB (metallophosphatase superfamily)